MSPENDPAQAARKKSRKPRRSPPPLPSDIALRLDVNVEQAMTLASVGRPTVMKRIHDGTYRARRSPTGAWILDKQSVLDERAREYANADLKPLPSTRPRGRPRIHPLSTDDAPKRGKGRPRKGASA
jgi:hypothetical protein